MTDPLRILAVSALWQGANDYAFVRAFRQAGHSVRVIPEAESFPEWRSRKMRILRKLLRRNIVEEYNNILLEETNLFKPDLFFVFKGPLVKRETIKKIKKTGCICIQFYPDTGFYSHSKHILGALPEYDWIFSTKPNHPAQLKAQYNISNASYIPHGYDSEVHFPQKVAARDVDEYSCDISFIGNISKKKYDAMAHVVEHLGEFDIKIWGAPGWQRGASAVAKRFQGGGLWGCEYSKAIGLSKINLGLLFEGNSDGASPDEITSRSFNIPASGGFMLHERSAEGVRHFREGEECGFFSDLDDLVIKIRYYLSHDILRQTIALAGRQRCLTSEYSTTDRARTVLVKYHELRQP